MWKRLAKCIASLYQKTLRNVLPEDVVIFSDKAYFHPSGTVQNSQPQSSSVVSAVLNFSVIGPSFFVKKMVRVKENSNRYCAMLSDFLWPNPGKRFNVLENVRF